MTTCVIMYVSHCIVYLSKALFIEKKHTGIAQKVCRFSRNTFRCACNRVTNVTKHIGYTSKGYTVPVEFCVDFLPRMNNVKKCTKMHLNEIGLTETAFCKSKVQLRQPPISWNISSYSAFYNRGVTIPVKAIHHGC